MRRQATVELLELCDDDFAWLATPAGDSRRRLSIPPGGIETPIVLEIVRMMTRRLHESGSRAAWAIVAEREVVGLCSHKNAVSADGEVEIGYGIAPSRRDRGYATAAVGQMLVQACGDARIAAVVAETAVANIASQRVLEGNGFARTGMRDDPQDAIVLTWRCDLAALRRPPR